MNNIQKIFVMVFVGSLVMLIISVSLDLKTSGINWIAIVCLFNIPVSTTGFFLFKDK
jgi:hypothetical protein